MNRSRLHGRRLAWVTLLLLSIFLVQYVTARSHRTWNARPKRAFSKVHPRSLDVRGGYEYDDPYSRRDYDDSYRDDFDDRRRPEGKNLWKSGDRRLGLMLTSGGSVLLILGITMFFNKMLIRYGNFLVLLGIPLFVGPARAVRYFGNPKKLRATSCVAAGIFLTIMWGWPMLGLILQAFGILNLFGNMFPMVWAVAKNMPVVSNVLKAMEDTGGSRRDQESDRYDPDQDDERYYNYQRDRDAWNNYGQQQQGRGYDEDPYYRPTHQGNY